MPVLPGAVGVLQTLPLSTAVTRSLLTQVFAAQVNLGSRGGVQGQQQGIRSVTGTCPQT